ncbi:hypothetical protein CLV91_1477 [Maribacter vaceletii]|uniref:Uncharacterized protein n=2 Tax=Maribacter vaceletii TaxID=1206816 RepID=A0A495EET8_9FLAO|nr:hypothetical protein CLV91_1477 [Maribacter vaceletii]
MTTLNKTQIPLWVNIMQSILILIMLGQVYMYFLNHQMIVNSGIQVEGIPNLNLIYEMGARTLVMAIISIYVMITQSPKQYIIILIMNVLREGLETIIDPLYPVLNAPASPMVDLGIHLIIVAIEVWAFVTVLRITKKLSQK